MAKEKTVYVCDHCGQESSKWQGKCPACGQWNTFKELRLHTSSARNAEVQARHALTGLDGHKAQPVPLRNVSAEAEPRIDTHDAELNRVLGGGLVPGSLVLLGGEPGIGKSTILLQICEKLSAGFSVLYVSGEESAYQIKMRAKRLGVTNEKLAVMCETDAEIICEYIRNQKPE